MIQVRRWKCMTSQVYQISLFNPSDQWTSFAADFRAKLFQLRESGKDFPILEVLYSLKSLGSPLFSDLSFYSLRTSEDCSITKEGLRSRRSSERWMDWGMTWSGRCLTQRPTFPKAGSGYSLSDILETHVPNKYFLSLDRLQHLIKTSEIW